MSPLKLDGAVPLVDLTDERWVRVICYPKWDLEALKKRLDELKELGVLAVEFAGEKFAFNTLVLGKGCSGVVVAVYTDKGKAALKIRRMDAGRADMQHEAEMLERANGVGVGPSILGSTNNFLLMELIDGKLLSDWLEMLRDRGTRSRIQSVLQRVLEQCWRLDEIGLDHGELSRGIKHVMICRNDNPCLVDFEKASLNRRVSNVTSMSQYLFIQSKAAEMIQRKLGEIERTQLISALRCYKQERNRKNFESFLNVCGLKSV